MCSPDTVVEWKALADVKESVGQLLAEDGSRRGELQDEQEGAHAAELVST